MIWDIHVVKHFVDSQHDFKLDVQFCSDAQRLVLFGPSGAGKSQTFKMIAGLSRPDEGHISLGGRVFFDECTNIHIPPQQRALGYVFQDYMLFPYLTVRQNLAFSLCSGWLNPPKNKRDQIVDHWLEVFQLHSVAHHYPVQLSGGQCQRVALGRALVMNPSALLLDEPFAALDRTLRAHLREELFELQVRLSLPMMLITHDEEDVDYFADQVMYIENGRLIS